VSISEGEDKIHIKNFEDEMFSRYSTGKIGPVESIRVRSSLLDSLSCDLVLAMLTCLVKTKEKYNLARPTYLCTRCINTCI